MGIGDALGKNGIFISDEARQNLMINLSQEEFDELKKQVKQDDEGTAKCFITGQIVPKKDGLYLTRDWVSSAIEKSLNSQQKKEDEFKKDKLATCEKCGEKFNYEENKQDNKHTKCPKCENTINLKKYRKSVKMSFVKKNMMRIWLKYLKGKTGRGIKG